MNRFRFSRPLLGALFAASIATVSPAEPARADTGVSKAGETDGAARAPKAADFAEALRRAEGLEALETLSVAVDGNTVLERGFRGHRVDRPANIKSASKSVVSALVGIAIDRGVLEGVDQTIAPLLRDKLPADPDPRLFEITIGDLLTMRAGLERTSGANYGGWVAANDWVKDALARPFVAEPGGRMLYSTGSTHLLSAILTRETGRSTLALARDWLAGSGVTIASWERSPQGIYLGGNQMAMTPRALLAFGELYRNEGRTADGEQIVPAGWIAESWKPYTRSRWSGDAYGYGWFTRTIGGATVHYGWGYGGQMIYVVPSLAATVAITSDPTAPSGRGGYKDALHDLVGETIIPAIEAVRASG